MAPAVTAFRVDWVMSPSRGDALFCCVKRSASRQNTVALNKVHSYFRLQP
ncbi:hypothetical protein CTX90_004192 [Salmonella enterica subsp. diarizonae]|nr:hypothetical protein [Salmonella enterica subsp. diarizonae]